MVSRLSQQPERKKKVIKKKVVRRRRSVKKEVKIVLEQDFYSALRSRAPDLYDKILEKDIVLDLLFRVVERLLLYGGADRQKSRALLTRQFVLSLNMLISVLSKEVSSTLISFLYKNKINGNNN